MLDNERERWCDGYRDSGALARYSDMMRMGTIQTG